MLKSSLDNIDMNVIKSFDEWCSIAFTRIKDDPDLKENFIKIVKNMVKKALRLLKI